MSQGPGQEIEEHGERSSTMATRAGATRRLIDGAIAFLRQHPALVLPLLYVEASAVGVTYMWRLYRSFGIDIFDFVEANDFLVAAVKAPTASPALFVAVIAGMAIAVFYIFGGSVIASQYSDKLAVSIFGVGCILVIVAHRMPTIRGGLS